MSAGEDADPRIPGFLHRQQLFASYCPRPQRTREVWSTGKKCSPVQNNPKGTACHSIWPSPQGGSARLVITMARRDQQFHRLAPSNNGLEPDAHVAVAVSASGVICQSLHSCDELRRKCVTFARDLEHSSCCRPRCFPNRWHFPVEMAVQNLWVKAAPFGLKT